MMIVLVAAVLAGGWIFIEVLADIACWMERKAGKMRRRNMREVRRCNGGELPKEHER